MLQSLRNLDRTPAQPCNPEKHLPSAVIAGCDYHPMAIVTPCPGSQKHLETQQAVCNRACICSCSSSSPQFSLWTTLSFLSQLIFWYLAGHFVTLYCQPSSPLPKPQTLSCLQRELQAQPNVNNHSMQRERQMVNTGCLLPGGQHHPAWLSSRGFSGLDPGAGPGKTSLGV